MLSEGFRRFAHRSATILGSVPAFVAAVAIIVIWVITGPIFHFSNTWQLVINTATTVITFLVVFLIQNTQNRETRALHLKIDELLRAVSAARTGFVNLEELSDKELDRLQAEFDQLGGRISEVKKRKRAGNPAGNRTAISSAGNRNGKQAGERTGGRGAPPAPS
jgi:low affinity Fe/Cu permease